MSAHSSYLQVETSPRLPGAVLLLLLVLAILGVMGQAAFA